MKSSRQKVILELVASRAVQTQDEIMNALRAQGYFVTQATVSRDIRELKLTKTLGEDGSYRYTVTSAGGAVTVTKINETLLGAITGIDYANNIIVLTTYPGMAQAVAAGIDSARTPSILGCVGGDDTIIIVTRNEETARDFCGSYRELKLGM